MQLDQECIDTLQELQEPLIRFYTWEKKTITHGYFINPESVLNTERAIELGFDLARRPTGGGLLFHYSDFSFTVCVPCHHAACSSTVLDTYALINRALLAAMHFDEGLVLCDAEAQNKTFSHLCMASPTKYDLIYQGKKIGGSAQRKTKYGFVHQSALFLRPPNWDEVAAIWRGSEEEFEAMKLHSSAVLPENSDDESVMHFRQGLQEAFAALLGHFLDDSLELHHEPHHWM